MTNPLTQNLAMAKHLLEFVKPGETRVGMLPVALQSARALALDMLRPLANSLEPGHDEAAFLLAAESPDDAESDENLVRAAVWDYADTRATIAGSGNADLQRRLEWAIARSDADID